MSHNFTFAARAPFLKRFTGKDPDNVGYSYSKSNAFVEKWRNKANTADISAARVDKFDRYQPLSTVNLAGIAPGTETGGTLFENNKKWSIASGTLLSVTVASNVGTLAFDTAHGLAVGAIIVLTGATVDTDLNATYAVTAASVSGDATKCTVTTSSVSNGTYTDAGIVVTTWQVFTAVGGCATKLLCAYSGASGDFATLRMRARSDAAGAVGGDGQLNGVVCGNFSASASINNQANLFALQGYAQPTTYTHNNAAHIACGVYSCIDASGASSGRRWSLWTDEHSTTKAAGGHYLHRLSYNPPSAGAGLDGVWTVYGPQVPFLFNFEYDQAGAPFVAGATIASGACLGTIRVKTSNGTTGYINVLAQS